MATTIGQRDTLSTYRMSKLAVAPRTAYVAAVHPLASTLADAADGRFPPIDGRFDVHPPERPGQCAIVEFTGHAVVLADLSHDALEALGADGFGEASHPRIKQLIAGRHGSIGSHDALLVAHGRGAADGAGLERRHDLDDHPRVARSRRHRRDVEVFTDDAGLVTFGRGLVGRLELSVELVGTRHGEGAGRRLIERALHRVPAGEPVWAQVAPGNAASLRAFLAMGFTPIGAETLIVA